MPKRPADSNDDEHTRRMPSHSIRRERTSTPTPTPTPTPAPTFPRVPPGFDPNPDPDPDDDAEDFPHLKLLAIHAPNTFNVAAAFYDSHTRRLQVLEDTKDTWAWDLCRFCKMRRGEADNVCEQTQPHKILVSNHAPDSLVAVIDEFCAEHPDTTSVGLPPREFHHALAQYQLANVRLRHDTREVLDDEGEVVGYAELEEDDSGAGLGRVRLSLLKMGCRVNVDAPNGVSAAGALISHVQHLLAKTQDDEIDFGLDTIESIDIEQYMLINQDALTSLAVFDIESHASMYSKDRKQGMSLNGKLRHRLKLFHTWLLRPLVNIDSINERLDAVEALARGDNVALRKELRKQLGGFMNMLLFCTRIKTGKGKWKDWQQLVLISRYLTDEVQTFLSDVVAIIDWYMSRDENRICVRSGIDDQIDKHREDYAGLEPLLNQMSVIMGRHTPPGMCEDVKVIYLPQMGCLLAASNIHRRELIPPDWEQQFEAKGLTYFKTPQMTNLDEHYGDLQNIIIDLEIEWVQRLIERLEPLEWQLMNLGDAIAEVDW
ncbi:unnamed protein product [Cutaneotrichosporon oleaginosum]